MQIAHFAADGKQFYQMSQQQQPMQDSATMHVYLENFQTSTDFTEIELNVSHQSQKCLTRKKRRRVDCAWHPEHTKKSFKYFFSSLAFPSTYYEGSRKSRYSFPPASFPAFQQLMHRSKFSPSFFKASKRICGFVLTDISRLTRCSCFPWYRRRIETLVREKTRVRICSLRFLLYCRAQVAQNGSLFFLQRDQKETWWQPNLLRLLWALVINYWARRGNF